MARPSITLWVIPLGSHDVDRDCPECLRTLRRLSWVVEWPGCRDICPPIIRFVDLCPEHGEVPSC